jgi:aminopeptidase
MRDARVEKLAARLLDFSVNLQAGEKILIDLMGVQLPLAQALIKGTYARGGLPFLDLGHGSLQRELLLGVTEEQLKALARFDLARMQEMQAYIGIRAGENANELVDVPGENLRLYQQLYSKPVHTEQRVRNTKWCVLRYPNYAMAQMAGMSLEAFEDFYFAVCTLDYAELSAAMEPLVRRLELTDKVIIESPHTELSFSVRGMKAIKCDGRMNLPDGEVFTAPVRDSVEGEITYNTPSLYQGQTFENVRLCFKRGRIVKAEANHQEAIEQILSTDEGASFIGEFALGVNPLITKPMKDILFDEKIAGSFHFTPGSCYEEADNGNISAVHWDLVQIQTPEYGGGDIIFDGELIRRDGLFVPDDLQRLNEM